MSTWLPTAPCTPGSCIDTKGGARLRGAVRLFAVLLLMLVAVATAFTIAGWAGVRRGAGGRPGSPRFRRAVRWWCRALVRAAGMRVRIVGEAPGDGGVLVVANHISWLDIPLLAAVRPARMLAKREIRDWPVAGPIAAQAALFIDRDRLRTLPETVAEIAGALRAGQAVAVFPEGSTWCGREQGHYRRAVFQAALDAGVPVQPVRIRYRTLDGTASTAPAFVGDDSLLTSVWRVVTARRLVAEVEVLPLVGAGEYPDRKSLARAAQTK